jgi:hypothetical protein
MKLYINALINHHAKFRENQSRMDNPETQAIVGTRHRMKTYKTKHHNIEN